jgi:eukaryotic-like serine/threonine-protein kinase
MSTDSTRRDSAPPSGLQPPNVHAAETIAGADPYATVASPARAANGSFSDATPGVGQRFRIIRSHARGGLGEVFVAHDLELNREVALKEIQGRHADEPASRARFLLEAEVTGHLEHPGIVPVYSLGQHSDGRPYYAMRFIRGENLKAAIERFHAVSGEKRDAGQRELELRRLLGRFVEVCNAVAYAHNLGIVHRDIKPENVMLGPFGEVLVVDWGIAKRLGEADLTADTTPIGSSQLHENGLTLEGTSLGTPQYMSPEQAQGRVDKIGPASDIYSLGATLYCLLTGRTPFEGRDLQALLARVVTGEFSPPRRVIRSLPKGLEAICLKAMALRPGDRYSTASTLSDDVERWMADETVAARRDGPLTRAARWIRHRPGLLPWIAIFAMTDIILLLQSSAARTLLDQRVAVINLSVAMLATVAACFVQVHVLIGALIGAVGGLFRGGVAKSIERGAVEGFRIGFALAALAVATIGLVLIYTAGIGFNSR